MERAIGRALCGRSLLLACLMAATLPSVASAYWYARSDDGATFSACVEFKETLDQTKDRLTRATGAKCEYVNDARFRFQGFIFSCGNAGMHFLFRSKENCNTFRLAVSGQREAKGSDYVPPGVANRDAWIVAYSACMEEAAIPGTVALAGLQWVADYCMCVSTKVATIGEAKLGGDGMANIVEGCSGKTLPPAMREFIAGGMDRALAKAKKSPAPTTPDAPPGVPQPRAVAPTTAVARETNATAKPKAKILKGDSYAEVMARLAGFKAEKKPLGDFLDATYTEPSLLAYPDAGGECVVTFKVARVVWCKGCSPDLFDCAL